MDPRTFYYTHGLREHSIILVGKIIKVLGFSHTQTHRERLAQYCIICFIFIFGILIQICQFFTMDLDLHSVAVRLQLFIPSISVASLYLTTVLHFWTIKEIFCYVHEDWQRLKNNVELKIVEKHAYETKLFSIILAVLIASFALVIILPAFLRKMLSTSEGLDSTEYRFPIPSCLDYFINREKYYYPILILQATLLVVAAAVPVCIYSTYFGLIQNACARLSIVKSKIHQPFNSLDHNDNILEVPIDLSDWMIDIIQHLARTTEFMKLVNKMSEKVYLFQMSLSFVFLVIDILCMPDLLEKEENRSDVLMFSVFIIGSLFPIYVNCYIGQQLMDYSLDVCEEACLIPIHEISLKTQKLLLTMLTMSVKPCAISIGKIFVSSHEFFQCLLRSALSFAMMLHSTQKV